MHRDVFSLFENNRSKFNFRCVVCSDSVWNSGTEVHTLLQQKKKENGFVCVRSPDTITWSATSNIVSHVAFLVTHAPFFLWVLFPFPFLSLFPPVPVPFTATPLLLFTVYGNINSRFLALTLCVRVHLLLPDLLPKGRGNCNYLSSFWFFWVVSVFL